MAAPSSFSEPAAKRLSGRGRLWYPDAPDSDSPRRAEALPGLKRFRPTTHRFKFYDGRPRLLVPPKSVTDLFGVALRLLRAAAPESAFAPQTLFSMEGQLLSYYFHPDERVSDFSNGYNGGPHLGWPRGMQEFYFNFRCPGCPEPKFVVDPTAPDFSNPDNPGKATTLIVGPPPTPGGALVFDSFERDNSTYILGGKGGLGATETGSSGAKTWQTAVASTQPQPFGILGGRAVILGNAEALTWVSTGALEAGVRTVLAANITLPPEKWKTLQVVTTQSGAINVYADNTLVHSTSSIVHAFATGAGLYNHGAGMGLSNRWDNFTVRAVP